MKSISRDFRNSKIEFNFAPETMQLELFLFLEYFFYYFQSIFYFRLKGSLNLLGRLFCGRVSSITSDREFGILIVSGTVDEF